jgi:hypothetical protein
MIEYRVFPAGGAWTWEVRVDGRLVQSNQDWTAEAAFADAQRYARSTHHEGPPARKPRGPAARTPR